MPTTTRTLLRDYRFWLLLLLATAVRCWQLPQRPLSGDEGYSLLLSQMSLDDIVHWTALDAHPPLYYFLLHGWLELVGHSVAGVRLLSVLPGVASVFVQAWLMDLLAGRRTAWLAGLLLAVAPFLVRYSQDVRMYSWLALWLWSATLVMVLWLRSPGRWPLLLLYSALMSAALYSHYFAGLALASHWCYLAWLWLRRGRRELMAPQWWAATGLVAVLFVPWLPSLQQQLQHTGWTLGWVPPVTAASLPDLIWTFTLLGDAHAWPTVLWLAWPLALLAVAVGLLVRRRHALEPAALLVASVLVPIVLVLAVSWKVSMFYPRYLIYPAGALPLLVALALDQALARHKAWAAAGLAVLAGLSAVGLHALFTGNDRVEKLPRADERVPFVAHYLGARLQPGDLVLTDSIYSYARVFFYLPEGVAMQVLAGPQLPFAYGYSGLLYRDGAADLLRSLDDVPPDVQRLWWLDFAHDAAALASFSKGGWRLVDHLQGQTPEVWLYQREARP